MPRMLLAPLDIIRKGDGYLIREPCSIPHNEVSIPVLVAAFNDLAVRYENLLHGFESDQESAKGGSAGDSDVVRRQGVLRLMIEMMTQPFAKMPYDFRERLSHHIPRLAVKLYDEMVAELEK